MVEETKKERLLVMVDPALKKMFHMVCIYEGVSMTDKLEDVLRLYTEEKLKEMNVSIDESAV